jgi:hypothetical protein
MALTDDNILHFLAPQVRDFGGQTEIEGGFRPIFVVAAADTNGNEVARELLAGVDFPHEVGESADDRWMLYCVTGEHLAAAVFWLDDLARFVSGEVRPVHAHYQALIDEACASAAPHRAARILAECHGRGEVGAGLIRRPETVRSFLDRLHQVEPLFFSAFHTLLTHHLFDLVVFRRRLIAEDLSLTKEMMGGGRPQDQFLQIRQDAAREIHGSLLRFEVIKANVPLKHGVLANPYADYLRLSAEGVLVAVQMDGVLVNLSRARYLRAIRMIRRRLYDGEEFSTFNTQEPWVSGEIAASVRFIRQRIESRSELSPMDSLYMLERAVES